METTLHLEHVLESLGLSQIDDNRGVGLVPLVEPIIKQDSFVFACDFASNIQYVKILNLAIFFLIALPFFYTAALLFICIVTGGNAALYLACTGDHYKLYDSFCGHYKQELTKVENIGI